MRKTKPKPQAFVLPPHANAEAHQKVMAQLKNMSDEEFFGTLVHAGIYDKEGNLLPPYADEEIATKTTKKSPARAVAAKTTRRVSK